MPRHANSPAVAVESLSEAIDKLYSDTEAMTEIMLRLHQRQREILHHVSILRQLMAEPASGPTAKQR